MEMRLPATMAKVARIEIKKRKRDADDNSRCDSKRIYLTNFINVSFDFVKRDFARHNDGYLTPTRTNKSKKVLTNLSE